MGEMAVIGVELVNELLERGFKLVWVKQGKLATVFYFEDTCELMAALDELMKEKI